MARAAPASRIPGTIATLTNSGTIEGGVAAPARFQGGGRRRLSAGKHASIGPITNSGQIIGNVDIDNQASVTVTGGSGKTFGCWTAGPSRSAMAT